MAVSGTNDLVASVELMRFMAGNTRALTFLDHLAEDPPGNAVNDFGRVEFTL